MRQQMVGGDAAGPGDQSAPVQALDRAGVTATATHDEMIDQHHAEQRGEHRADQQQEVLVLRQRREAGDQGAQYTDGQCQMLDLQANQQAG
ncbi:hypothetical protein D3C79_855660 [compost metagenome]